MKKFFSILVSLMLCSTTALAAQTEEQYKHEAIDHVVEIAQQEVGYLEKASNSNLYEKTANAGDNNYTKYAKELADNNFYEYNLNGYAWCDMFVDWSFVLAFGTTDAKYITYQVPYGSAGCAVSMSYYKNAGQFFNEPQKGDQVFFSTSHTGLVYKVDDTKVYTIEGNTANGQEVINNGGAVCAKEYDLNAPKIVGYGRPNYDYIATKAKQLEEKREAEEAREVLLGQLIRREWNRFDSGKIQPINGQLAPTES